MKIALDFAFTLAGGVAPYFKEMVRLLPEVDPRNEYLLLITAEGYAMVKDFVPGRNIKCKVIPALQSNVLRFIWEQSILPLVLKREKVDVIYCVNNRVPLIKTSVKKVMLLGTLGPFIDEFIDSAGFWGKIRYRILAKLIVLSLNSADTTIFESFYTKELVESKYGYKGRWRVNYHSRPGFKSEDLDRERIKKVRQKYALNNDYFLYVTYVRKYKNLERAIKAFARAQSRLERPLDFVVAGPAVSRGYLEELLKLCRDYGVEESFRFIGMVDYNELAALSFGCLGYVFVSKFENLSYALVEALTYGLPIIASRGTAMPETCGEAALYFDAEDTQGLADAMVRLANDQALRQKLSVSSTKQAKRFRSMKEDIEFNIGVFRELQPESAKLTKQSGLSVLARSYEDSSS